MFRHNFLLIYRNFKRFKSTFFINLTGLSTGLACSLLIYLWVADELSIDKFHEKQEQLYQVMTNYKNTDGIKTNSETDGILAEALKEEMPEVEFATVATPVYWFGKFTISTGDNNIKATGRYAGKDFFNIFSYKLLNGDKGQVLSDKNSIVISKQLATKLFNTAENVVGKIVTFQHDKQFLISGVFEEIPHNATDQFDFILPFANFLEQHPQFSEWDHRGPATYLVLNEEIQISQFNKKLSSFYQTKTKESNITLFVNRYADAYLYGNYENGVQAGGRIEYVKLFSIIAIFILVIACINFMNLSTAKATRRIKEVGIKKAIGASRKMLVYQYMGEAILITSLSLLLAVILIELFIPTFNAITAKQLALNFNLQLVLTLVGISIFTGLLAGSYPALYLSGFNPVAVLKGKLNSSSGELWARKGLVVFQFTISIILIVAVFVVYKQIEFVQAKNIGYDKEHVITFDMEGKVAENPSTFIAEITKVPGIVSATSTNSRLIGSYGATSGLDWEGKNPNDIISFELVQVNYDFMETLGISMAAGRSFSKEHRTDSTKLIFNEAAVEAMALKAPVGKVISFWGKDAEILGVAKDFHIESLHQEVKPMVFRLLPQHTDYIMAKIEAGREKETIARLHDYYKTFNPGFALEYKFLDESYQALYESEKRVADLSKYFAGLAIVISCLGLFGLAAFTAERRLKEIGIRKILGSDEFGIIYLLSSDFTKMVVTAIFIALPISYFLVKNWLDNFAYKIPLEFWYFLGAGFIALVISWLTVGFHAVKAARVNPAVCLKDE